MIVASALVASGCFYTWVHVDNANEVANERIQLADADGAKVELENARICGPTLIGVPTAESGPTCDCASSCLIVDTTRAHVSVRRVSAVRTVGMYTLFALVFVSAVIGALVLNVGSNPNHP